MNAKTLMRAKELREEVEWGLKRFFKIILKVVLLSATMPTEILDVTKRFMRDPIQILVKKEELTLEGIRQFYVNVEKEEWKVRSFFFFTSYF